MLRKTKRLFPALGIVVLSFLLLMGSVSAFFVEDFDTDTAGTNPSAPWYTYTENADSGSVSVTTYKSVPNSFRHKPTGFAQWSLFTFNQSKPVFVNMSLNSTTNIGFPQIMIKNGITVVARSLLNQIVTPQNFSIFGDSTLIHVNQNEWFDISFRFNWSSEEYCLSANNGSGWVNRWTAFLASVPYIDGIFFGDFGAHTIYIDDISVDVQPEAQLVSPANNSVLITKTVSLSVKVWDNDTTLPINVSFYIYQGFYTPVTWVNLSSSYIGTTKSVVSGSTAYFNFTPCSGLSYAWFIKLTSDGDTKYYPQSGYNWSGDLGVPDPNCDFVWLFTAKTNSYPTVTINYPLNGATYTSYQWQNNHNLSFSVSDAEGDHITLNWMSISTLYGFVTFQSPVIWQSIYNSSFTLDLKPWVTFDNMSYNITFMIDDDAHCYVFNGTFASSSFTIGTANTKTHFSVKDCYPPDGDDNAIASINTGITFDACTNITQSGAPTIWLFLVDMDKTLTTVGGTVFSFNPLTCMGNRYCNYVISNTEVWRHFSFAKGFLQVRHTYKVYVGILTGGSVPNGAKSVMVSPSSRVEADFIYDLSARSMGFSYDKDIGYYPVIFRMYEDMTSGDSHFVGVTWEFSTYPVGETPLTGDIGDTTTGSTWGRTLFAHVDTGLVSWLELITGLFVVAMFTVMPYILLKKKWSGRSVAMPINITFTAFGLVMAYGMGLLPLWIFVPPVFIIMIILVYKITVWITSRKQLIGGEEGGA